MIETILQRVKREGVVKRVVKVPAHVAWRCWLTRRKALGCSM